MKRDAFLLSLLLALALIAASSQVTSAQDAASELLTRVNNLRASLGLPAYRWNNALAAAAANQARWMVDNNQVSHTQPDGSTPRSRARAAGYPSQLVSENIYMGGMASVDAAWNFWVNSAVHYAGLTNARYDEVGIATATGAGGRAYVMVFGTSSSNWEAQVAAQPSGGNRPAAAAPPPLPIVGVDNVGNIMYEIQPGDDLGTIALLFGYSWGDLPAIMDLNGLTQEDIRLLRIGSVLLVPPKSGTYTPTPEPTRDPSIPTETPTPTPTLTPTETPTPTLTPTPTDLPPAVFVMPTPTPTRELIVRTLEPVVALVATPSLQEVTLQETPAQEAPTGAASGLPAWLIAAVVVQVGIIVGAAVQYFRGR